MTERVNRATRAPWLTGAAAALGDVSQIADRRARFLCGLAVFGLERKLCALLAQRPVARAESQLAHDDVAALSAMLVVVVYRLLDRIPWRRDTRHGESGALGRLAGERPGTFPVIAPIAAARRGHRLDRLMERVRRLGSRIIGRVAKADGHNDPDALELRSARYRQRPRRGIGAGSRRNAGTVSAMMSKPLGTSLPSSSVRASAPAYSVDNR